ncbi:MAG: c-type cytochrome [Pirellulales bacterium]|nr:c-type cytochrome [Pirellulales bacterium]
MVVSGALAGEPRVLIKGAELELVAAEPEIVTPISIAFDEKGRLLVIESHTHSRQAGYEGPKGDRIRMLSDSDGDGTLDRWSTFAEGFQQAMNLCTAGPGAVYVVTRRDVQLLRDTDDDGVADEHKSILLLVTNTHFAHNGLSGICLQQDGAGNPKLLVGLGENFGAAYVLIGADGKEIGGRGGSGTIFQCSADGKGLRRLATGFWNPFAITTLPGGRIFAVDNDPDASPPCRLVHVVESGDYGFRWEYSRAGTHPLQAWNGELPGTLPMVCGTGEAPCAVVPYRGRLWVTSWGDYRLERYELKPRGASFAAVRETVVQGDANFRPTGCAVAPDGSIYFADWVDRSYPVHHQGRIWRLRLSPADSQEFPEISPTEQLAVSQPGTRQELEKYVQDDDPFVRQAAVRNWLQAAATWREELLKQSTRSRLARLQGLRWAGDVAIDVESTLQTALKDTSLEVRLYALRWIADEQWQSLRGQVAGLLEEEISDERYFLTVLAVLDWLDKKPGLRKDSLSDELLVRQLKSTDRPASLQALALRLISPRHKFLTLERLRGYLQSEHAPLRLEAVRTLALQEQQNRFELLAEVADDAQQSDLVRAEAVAGLAAGERGRGVLKELEKGEHEVLAKEAKRFLRLSSGRKAPTETKPAATDLIAWNRLLAGQGDAAAGRRLFFSQVGPRCGNCHQHRGRGRRIGPDLTHIAKSNSREQIIASILQPSRDIAPSYQSWTLQTDAGKTYAGLRLPKPGDDGLELYADANGEVFQLRSDQIESRQISEVSIMPSGLEKTLSRGDLRDLVEFLLASKTSK